jgi:hypothetical protein
MAKTAREGMRRVPSRWWYFWERRKTLPPCCTARAAALWLKYSTKAKFREPKDHFLHHTRRQQKRKRG